MPLVENKAAKAIQTIKSRRFSLSAIAKWLKENHDITVDKSLLSRISTGERPAYDQLEKALVKAARAMK